MKIARFRALRRSCRITAIELARDLGISWQRLGHLENNKMGYMPEDPERLIKALETAVMRRMAVCEKTLDRCKNMRNHMFDYVKESEA